MAAVLLRVYIDLLLADYSSELVIGRHATTAAAGSAVDIDSGLHPYV